MFLQESYLRNLANINKSEIINYKFLTFTDKGPSIILISGVDIATFKYDEREKLLVKSYQTVYFVHLNQVSEKSDSSLYIPFSHPRVGYFIPASCDIVINKDGSGYQIFVDEVELINWQPITEVSTGTEEVDDIFKQNKNVVAFKRKD